MLFLFLPLGSYLGIKGKDFYLISFLGNDVVFSENGCFHAYFEPQKNDFVWEI
jgi:hypothetical protein